MTLYTKCILKSPSPEDGLRISIMSRHTLSDGKTPDSRINLESYDKHWKFFAPEPKLIGSYYRNEIGWDNFEERYLKQVRSPQSAGMVKYLAKVALKHDITILCIEEGCEQCHRRILAEECQRIIPDLRVRHI